MRRKATVPAPTLEEIRRWTNLVSVTDAALAFGMSRSAALKAIAAGQWPTPIVRIGKRDKVRKVDILRVLGDTTGETSA